MRKRKSRFLASIFVWTLVKSESLLYSMFSAISVNGYGSKHLCKVIALSPKDYYLTPAVMPKTCSLCSLTIVFIKSSFIKIKSNFSVVLIHYVTSAQVEQVVNWIFKSRYQSHRDLKNSQPTTLTTQILYYLDSDRQLESALKALK